MNVEIKHRVSAAFLIWKKYSGLLCARRVPCNEIEMKVYTSGQQWCSFLRYYGQRIKGRERRLIDDDRDEDVVG